MISHIEDIKNSHFNSKSPLILIFLQFIIIPYSFPRLPLFFRSVFSSNLLENTMSCIIKVHAVGHVIP
jgi:hypothetical protein